MREGERERGQTEQNNKTKNICFFFFFFPLLVPFFFCRHKRECEELGSIVEEQRNILSDAYFELSPRNEQEIDVEYEDGPM